MWVAQCLNYQADNSGIFFMYCLFPVWVYMCVEDKAVKHHCQQIWTETIIVDLGDEIISTLLLPESSFAVTSTIPVSHAPSVRQDSGEVAALDAGMRLVVAQALIDSHGRTGKLLLQRSWEGGGGGVFLVP